MVVPRSSKWAWSVGALNIPISFGWAAGDVSLAGKSCLPVLSDKFSACVFLLTVFFRFVAAYIQASLSNMEFEGHENVSALGAVMALLYCTYIVLNAVLSTVLGRIVDQDFVANGNIYKSLEQIAG